MLLITKSYNMYDENDSVACFQVVKQLSSYILEKILEIFILAKNSKTIWKQYQYFK